MIRLAQWTCLRPSTATEYDATWAWAFPTFPTCVIYLSTSRPSSMLHGASRLPFSTKLASTMALKDALRVWQVCFVFEAKPLEVRSLPRKLPTKKLLERSTPNFPWIEIWKWHEAARSSWKQLEAARMTRLTSKLVGRASSILGRAHRRIRLPNVGPNHLYTVRSESITLSRPGARTHQHHKAEGHQKLAK